MKAIHVNYKVFIFCDHLLRVYQQVCGSSGWRLVSGRQIVARCTSPQNTSEDREKSCCPTVPRVAVLGKVGHTNNCTDQPRMACPLLAILTPLSLVLAYFNLVPQSLSRLQFVNLPGYLGINPTGACHSSREYCLATKNEKMTPKIRKRRVTFQLTALTEPEIT